MFLTEISPVNFVKPMDKIALNLFDLVYCIATTRDDQTHKHKAYSSNGLTYVV